MRRWFDRQRALRKAKISTYKVLGCNTLQGRRLQKALTEGSSNKRSPTCGLGAKFSSLYCTMCRRRAGAEVVVASVEDSLEVGICCERWS